MSSARKKSKWGGLLMGPFMVCVALVALWKNETRFVYARAAVSTLSVIDLNGLQAGELISMTGSMDQQLSFPGEYVERFTGHLVVWRDAQIYAWQEDEDDDGTTWSMRWMSNLERNSRNSRIVQRLSSNRFMPEGFVVGDLKVKRDLVEFVDPVKTIDAQALTLSNGEIALKLRLQEGALYLNKGATSRLGDERVHYSGILVPETGTYFGKFDGVRGVADETDRRTGFFASIISDSGILHHIVAGDREVAIATMKSHIGRLKWMVRGVGTAAVVLGFLLFMSTIVGFLFHIPVLGSIAHTGVFALSLIIGIPLALITIIAGYLASQPVVLLLILGVVAAAILYVANRGATSQASFKGNLEREFGRQLNDSDLTELEFIQLALLAQADSIIGTGEEKMLRQWAKKHRWDEAKYNQMMKRAMDGVTPGSGKHVNEGHLETLMRLALADGTLSSHEVTAIKHISRRAGYSNNDLNAMIRRLRSEDGATAV